MKAKARLAVKIFISLLIFLILLALVGYALGKPQEKVSWGINYSTVRAKDLNFDPEQLFIQILDDLQPTHIRLPAYWEEIEVLPTQFNFDLYHRLLAETDKRGIKVILALGHKQPRWPECHHPEWWKQMTATEQDRAVLTMIEKSVGELRSHPSIVAWQVENEPLFPYGPDCPIIGRQLYVQELDLVRSLDSRPIISTDSGEKGAWLPVAWGGIDILGSTMYREVYHDKRQRYLTYPIPAWTYNVKAGLVRLFSGANQTIGVELQAEPWFAGKGAQQTPYAEQLEHMSPEILQRNINYARQVGFSENYLWGTEWWYWLNKVHKDDSLIQTAKQLFKQ